MVLTDPIFPSLQLVVDTAMICFRRGKQMASFQQLLNAGSIHFRWIANVRNDMDRSDLRTDPRYQIDCGFRGKVDEVFRGQDNPFVSLAFVLKQLQSSRSYSLSCRARGPAALSSEKSEYCMSGIRRKCVIMDSGTRQGSARSVQGILDGSAATLAVSNMQDEVRHLNSLR